MTQLKKSILLINQIKIRVIIRVCRIKPLPKARGGSSLSRLSKTRPTQAERSQREWEALAWLGKCKPKGFPSSRCSWEGIEISLMCPGTIVIVLQAAAASIHEVVSLKSNSDRETSNKIIIAIKMKKWMSHRLYWKKLKKAIKKREEIEAREVSPNQAIKAHPQANSSRLRIINSQTQAANYSIQTWTKSDKAESSNPLQSTSRTKTRASEWKNNSSWPNKGLQTTQRRKTRKQMTSLTNSKFFKTTHRIHSLSLLLIVNWRMAASNSIIIMHRSCSSMMRASRCTMEERPIGSSRVMQLKDSFWCNMPNMTD